LRTETDALGSMELPEDALYGINSARARDNFCIGFKPANARLVRAIIKVKQAMARARITLGEDLEKFGAIDQACDKALSGEHDSAFIVDALQGGAGTSTHMNVNEVLANLALLILGKKPGEYAFLDPLDDVNRGQSTNDVYPTALRIASIELLRNLSDSAAKLQESLQRRENEFECIAKLGRTELMDAVPITLGSEFGAYAQAIARDRWRLYKVEERLRLVNLGGSAVGAARGRQAPLRARALEELRSLTGIGLAGSEHPMDITQNNDVFVEASGLVKAHAVSLIKIANDLRLMGSGPRGGLGELTLAPLQAGSTIMPGKTNPVIPEMVMQIAMKAIAGDAAITEAASRGELELNAFLPLIADAMLENLELLEKADTIFRTKCIDLIMPNIDKCKELLEGSFAFAMEYAPVLGYATVARAVSNCGGDVELLRSELVDLAKKRAK
jgi:aspartate ammonia-lyase